MMAGAGATTMADVDGAGARALDAGQFIFASNVTSSRLVRARVLDMSIRAITSGLLLASLTISSAFASGAEDLAKAKGCFGCHMVRGSSIAPSFQDIASRFAGLKNAKPMLVHVVITGTNDVATPFHWGGMKMPPDVARVEVNQVEAEQLVDYVLSVH